MSYTVPGKTLDRCGRNLLITAFGTFSTFNRMVGSFENNVLVKARRFRFEALPGAIRMVLPADCPCG